MRKPDPLEFATNSDGKMLDAAGNVVYCDAEMCSAPAMCRVAASVLAAHDETRNYCECCADVYFVGVQHGRFHEAAHQGKEPGRDSSQERPHTPRKRGTGK